MIHHLRRAAKRTHPCFVAPRFVSNTEQALRLVADKEKDRSHGPDFWKLFLEKSSWRLCNAKAVAWGDLTIAAESLHQFSGLNPAVDSVLRGDIRDVLIVYSDHDHGANTSTHSRARDVETMRSPLRLMKSKQEEKVAKRSCTIQLSFLPSKSW